MLSSVQRDERIVKRIIDNIKNNGYEVKEYRKVGKPSGQKKVYFINVDEIEYVLKIVNVTPNIALEGAYEEGEINSEIKYEVERLSKRTVKEIKMGKECRNLPQLKLLSELQLIQIESMYYIYYIEEKKEGEPLEYVKEYTFYEIIDFIFQMVENIIIMNKKGYVHRDIKPDNIIVKDNKYSLIDGGICKNIYEDENLTVIGSAIGTKRYRAPEQEKVYPNTKWTFQTDLYPIGLIAIEMFLKETRLYDKDELKDLQIIKNAWMKKDDSEISQKIFKKVITNLCNPIRALRFNNLEKMEQILIEIKEEVK